MLKTDSPHSERFQQLLGEVREEIDSLKAQISALQNENARLKGDLKEMKDNEADIFSPVKETERMALKHQLKGLISKIDEHLED